MAHFRPVKLVPPLDVHRDHVLGNPHAEMTLLEYGSYACVHCHAVHEIITDLRKRFGDRLRYAYRHRPVVANEKAAQAAELAEQVAETGGDFWAAHDALMRRGPKFEAGDLEKIAESFNLPVGDGADTPHRHAARQRVKDDAESARLNGIRATPAFFINGRRYEGPWDESSLADALLGSLGHRIRIATRVFVGWAPSAGLLLLLMSVLAVVLSNLPVGPAFHSWWTTTAGFQWGGRGLMLPLLDWVNHGLLSIFFLVVGLEIKREFTVGHLSTLRAAALPVFAAAGGIVLPALIYLLITPSGPLKHGWGIPIATDTAFAIAVIVLLGKRVPVELRVFLTAAVIIDDLVAIAVIAVFYAGEIHVSYLIAAGVVTGLLIALNRWSVYRALPYAVLGIILWIFLHEAGLHATLSGVILALVTPTRPPANLRTLMTQADIIIQTEMKRAEANPQTQSHPGPSDRLLRSLDAIHNRIESPADKLLRSIEPWSSYVVLPVFALANAGVLWSLAAFDSHARLMLAVVLGLVVGKPVGIVIAAWIAVMLGLAVKPTAYTWRQLAGAGALAGIGFTMSLFIAGEAFPDPQDYAAAKIAIFIASLLAGGVGAAILYPKFTSRPSRQDKPETAA